MIGKKINTSIHIAIIASVAVSLQSCGIWSSLQPNQSAWQGHSIEDLTSSWGQADRTEQLGVDYAAYTWLKPGTGCEQTFLVSDGRITGFSNTGCDD